MKTPAGQTDSLASIPEWGSPLRNSAVAKKATGRPFPTFWLSSQIRLSKLLSVWTQSTGPILALGCGLMPGLHTKRNAGGVVAVGGVVDVVSPCAVGPALARRG